MKFPPSTEAGAGRRPDAIAQAAPRPGLVVAAVVALLVHASVYALLRSPSSPADVEPPRHADAAFMMTRVITVPVPRYPADAAAAVLPAAARHAPPTSQRHAVQQVTGRTAAPTDIAIGAVGDIADPAAKPPVEPLEGVATPLATSVPGTAVAPHWPTSALESPPLPRSEPDPSRLQGAFTSGLPIRLRLFIDTAGTVENIDVLQASELDADAVDRTKAMFYETQFLAGKRGGSEVPSYMDIEVDVAHYQ